MQENKDGSERIFGLPPLIAAIVISIIITLIVTFAPSRAKAHEHVAEDGTVMERVTHVRYIDRFEERNGEWRIQKRLVSYDWSTVTPVTGTNLMQPSFLTGKRAPDDAWYHILD